MRHDGDSGSRMKSCSVDARHASRGFWSDPDFANVEFRLRRSNRLQASCLGSWHNGSVVMGIGLLLWRLGCESWNGGLKRLGLRYRVDSAWLTWGGPMHVLC